MPKPDNKLDLINVVGSGETSQVTNDALDPNGIDVDPALLNDISEYEISADYASDLRFDLGQIDTLPSMAMSKNVDDPAAPNDDKVILTIVCDNEFVLTEFDDTFTATNQNDCIEALAGDDWIDGLGGDDLIYGGDGRDLLFGGFGHDILYGDNGNDDIRAEAGNDLVYGGTGNDNFPGEWDFDIMYGGDGDDLFEAGQGGQTNVYAGDGNDTILAEGTDLLAYGGVGDDFMQGSNGSSLYGGDDDDIIRTGANLAGTDEVGAIQGGNGDDTIIFDGVNTAGYAFGGTGNDSVSFEDGGSAHWVMLKEGDDSVVLTEHARMIDGGTGNDTFDVYDIGSEVVVTLRGGENQGDNDKIWINDFSEVVDASFSFATGNGLMEYESGTRVNFYDMEQIEFQLMPPDGNEPQGVTLTANSGSGTLSGPEIMALLSLGPATGAEDEEDDDRFADIEMTF